MTNQTASFLDEGESWNAAALQRHALQGLWGGRIITVSGAGPVVARLVGRGMWEQQNDVHPIFDTLSAAILKLESQTRTLEPVYTGPYG